MATPAPNIEVGKEQLQGGEATGGATLTGGQTRDRPTGDLVEEFATLSLVSPPADPLEFSQLGDISTMELRVQYVSGLMDYVRGREYFLHVSTTRGRAATFIVRALDDQGAILAGLGLKAGDCVTGIRGEMGFDDGSPKGFTPDFLAIKDSASARGVKKCDPVQHHQTPLPATMYAVTELCELPDKSDVCVRGKLCDWRPLTYSEIPSNLRALYKDGETATLWDAGLKDKVDVWFAKPYVQAIKSAMAGHAVNNVTVLFAKKFTGEMGKMGVGVYCLTHLYVGGNQHPLIWGQNGQ